MAVRHADEREALGEPARRGARAAAGPADGARHLRRDGRPRAPQAAARALQPRPRGRAARALQAGRRRAAREGATTTSAPSAATSICEYSRRTPDAEVLDGLLEHVQYVASTFDDPNGYVALAQALDALDEEAGQPLNRDYYLSTAPEFFPVIVEQLKGAGLHRHPQADVRVHHREAVRHRPALGARAAEGRLERLPRAPGLPHRPLPGQGDRPERDGVPVREHDVRAGLEPELHRPHPDHRRRGHRHRHARRLLRPGGRAARPRAEPHAPARRADLHGAAGVVRGRQGARREGQGAHGDHAAATRPRRCARSTRRARRAARRSSATSRRRACRTDSHTETYAALKLEVHNWRWAGVPIFLRTGKRLARKVTEIAVQLKPVPHLAFQSAGLGRRAAEPARPHRAAQRGRLALARGEDPRLAHADPAGEHGVPLRLARSCRSRPRPTSG